MPEYWDGAPGDMPKTEAECVVCRERFWVEFPREKGYVLEESGGYASIVCNDCLGGDKGRADAIAGAAKALLDVSSVGVVEIFTVLVAAESAIGELNAAISGCFDNEVEEGDTLILCKPLRQPEDEGPSND